MLETEIIIVRHGETQWNLDGRWQGHEDSPLTDQGIRQARAVGLRLKDLTFTMLYSSDLRRAYHTAKMISEVTGHEIVTDYRLRERNLGIFEGLTLLEMENQQPDAYNRYRALDPDYIIEQGES